MKPRRTKEEWLLLLVSLAAGAVAVFAAWDVAPAEPVRWSASGVALGLALGGFVAFLLAGAVRKAASQPAPTPPAGDARRVLAALPDGLVIVDGGRIVSLNPAFSELLGYAKDDLVGQRAPFPFWPPEHRHEIEGWHAELDSSGENTGSLMLLHRSGVRVPVLVSGRAVAPGTRDKRVVLTLRDVAESYRRERRLSELSSRDPETALLNEQALEEHLREAVRRAIAEGTNTSVVVATLEREGASVRLGSADALLAVERLRGVLRAGDELARTEDDALAWILPYTNADGAVEAVMRARAVVTDLGLTLTAGVCDLAESGDAPSLLALADRAHAAARRDGGARTANYGRRGHEAVAVATGPER